MGDRALGSVILPGELDELRAAGVNLTTTPFPGTGHNSFPAFQREYLADLRAFLARVEAA